jgi:hypothetical protein
LQTYYGRIANDGIGRRAEYHAEWRSGGFTAG